MKDTYSRIKRAIETTVIEVCRLRGRGLWFAVDQVEIIGVRSSGSGCGLRSAFCLKDRHSAAVSRAVTLGCSATASPRSLSDCHLNWV